MSGDEVTAVLSLEVEPSIQSEPPVEDVFDKYPILRLCKTLCEWAITIFACSFIVFVLYIVVGGILGGESAILNGRPYIAAPLMLFLMTVIATLEGFAFSITVLKLSNLQAFRDDYPIAASVHKFVFGSRGIPGEPDHIVSAQRLDKVLMGRQVFLIVLVFIVAQVTSFPNMNTWPFSDTPFPEGMTPWFQSKPSITHVILVLPCLQSNL